ncbi:DUF1566 domain-containing protein [Vibrio parahaemolyticus]|uniref:Lcl domain-containing protein n=1 Tax=Vibrio parahaemolyticus TaxID=670 RepID=UPI001123E25D|nr:DUF1566 domain-containing protein [Vibrio parahaemolyticus]EKQ5900212.1 DUF1566 domain-containing protein [Vibrio parahaemolyticus]ELA8135703.1 DUF1566 domain-containing protein [Vibrio parahaemolyticus]MDF4473651.1 DUF1566 domain-containing protein [Vibrio parahaemolyticus]MDF4478157.1 DUF1566 domain-containing protein [Vibrio parahaemolyticus]MDG3406079.1 DUF1566 domain-containing protein [Vibrio parahaemolyticus]
MKFQYSLIAVSLALVGCGGGSGSSDATAPSYNVAGTISAKGTLLDTPVCIDLNQNFVCDATEPSTKSDNAGEFSITSTNKNILTSPILAQVDQGDELTLNMMTPGRGLSKGNDINGVTTLIAALVIDGKTVSQAEQVLKDWLAHANVKLSGSVMSDPNASELEYIEQNTVGLLSKMKPEHITLGMTTMAQTLSYNDKSLAAYLLSDAEVSELAAKLSSLSALGSIGNDTGTVLYFTVAKGHSNTATPQELFPGQDAEFGFDKLEKQAATGNGFKFVKLSATGEKLKVDATTWACTLDERTGLVWENKSADENSLQFKDRLFVYESEDFKPFSKDLEQVGCVNARDDICSTKQYIEHINQKSLCGITNWRLPDYQEFYDVLDFGETEKDASGVVYGMNFKFFPQQTLGSPYLEYGSVWFQAFTFTENDKVKTPEYLRMPLVTVRGADRGQSSSIEIYSDKKDPTADDSYQFPIRLVAEKGE